MEHLLIRRHYSRNTLFLLFLFTCAAVTLLYWNLDFINDIYFRNQHTPTGLLINGTITILFLLGMFKISASLLHYAAEEKALYRFIRNLDEKEKDPLRRVPLQSLIAKRFSAMELLHKAKTPINQSILASTLVASESTRNSLARFISNILILTGVFGTVVSLSLALLGASDMLEGSVNVGGMGLIIHGMSTALSTTITAIVCYLFFGFFLLKLNDVQTNLISAVEQVTNNNLVPRFQVQTENVLYEFVELLQSLQLLVRQMEMSQATVGDLEKRLNFMFEEQGAKDTRVAEELNAIKYTLQHGLENRLGLFFDDNSQQAAKYVEELADIKALLIDGFRLREPK